ncbi:MAG: prepilin-type N-terminal cleavage/methylation domain-containing protein [Verrucomicrobia bacterium]|jgi:prepilin-type N-terminal cleavage/methylation domain-containing protein|nr:prepilin-type N-terminal cleavage/methylation domain-containing protein [Verrucomicrobiota bacterium]
MKRNTKQAFTLIELLVVISIILLASSIIFIGGTGGDGAKLSSAQRIVSGIAQGARGQAILKNAVTRLIIYSDATANEDDEKKLRYFGIVYADPEDPDPENPTNWIAATQGTYLSEGIYFNKTLSSNNSWSQSSTITINYPRLRSEPEGSGDEYYYYEFNSNGTMSSDFINNWLVLQAGTLKPDSSGNLAVDFLEEEKENLKTALIFRRAGTTTIVNEPGDIN